MSQHDQDETTGAERPDSPGQATDQAEWRRKRRLAEIFGDVLPQQTGDDREDPSAPDRGESASERWLKSQVPPHHGG